MQESLKTPLWRINISIWLHLYAPLKVQPRWLDAEPSPCTAFKALLSSPFPVSKSSLPLFPPSSPIYFYIADISAARWSRETKQMPFPWWWLEWSGIWNSSSISPFPNFTNQQFFFLYVSFLLVFVPCFGFLFPVWKLPQGWDPSCWYYQAQVLTILWPQQKVASCFQVWTGKSWDGPLDSTSTSCVTPGKWLKFPLRVLSVRWW